MNRDAFVGKLERIITAIQTEKDLPLHVKEIHVFGSFARGKEDPGDLDLILIHETLTRDQEEQEMKAIEGLGTSLEQKMNNRLKSNRESVDIAYGATLEQVITRFSIKPKIIVKLWSKDDHQWQVKLAQIGLPS